jgi:F-type H+-transporting ATPase subunit gamma
VTQLAEIQGHIASMGELLNIVGAMRSLASMRVQEAQRALPGIRRYAESMAQGIGTALLLMPDAALATAADGRRALILCAGEHGFVGGFNERLIEAAGAASGEGDLMFVLGSRGAALALERRGRVDWNRPMPTTQAGAPEAASRLADELYSRIARHEIGRVEVMFSRYRQGGGATIETRLLLPVDFAALALRQPRQAPLHNLAPQPLLEKLMAEYVFALLTEAVVESISSENAARFAAMESAHENVKKKLSQLREAAGQARQSEITAELLDLITGAEALAVREAAKIARSPPGNRPFS